jgi:hypothetical protein
MHAERKLLAWSADPGVNTHCPFLPGTQFLADTQAERQYREMT